MSGGLVTSLMLSEDYVVNVLGFERSSLNEGRYNMKLQQEILEAHLIAEGWFSDGVKWLKKKGVDGYEAVKDKAMEIPNAIKEFGSDITGVVAALTAMAKDPEEAKGYASGIYSAIRGWPRSLIKNLGKISKWMEDHNMPSFAKGIDKISEMLKSLWQGAGNMGGWAGSVSMMAFGLATKYIEEEFGILEKARTVKNYISEPKELVKDLGGDLASDALDDIKDFFNGKIDAVVENSALFKQIAKFLEEKLGFLETIKEKFFDFTKKIAGNAVASFAGPIGWIKQLAELFQSSSWVVSNLAIMLQKQSLSL
jgi:hypothetical protein